MAFDSELLGPIVQNILDAIRQRQVTVDGQQIGKIPSQGDPARSVRGLLAGRATGVGSLDSLQADLNLLYKHAVVNYLVNSGLLTQEDAEAKVAKVPDFILGLIGKQSGHQQALSHINQFLLRSGYVDPNTLDNPSAKQKQIIHNKKLDAVAKGLFSFIRPDNKEKTIQGMRPDDVMNIVLSKPGAVLELAETPGFLDNEGNISRQGYTKLASKLRNTVHGLKVLSTLTGKTSLPETVQAGSQLLGGNTLDLLSNDKAISKLSRMLTLTRHLGGTQGDLVSLIDASRQIAEKRGWGPDETVNFASSVAPWMLKRPANLNDAQTAQYNFKIMSQAANPETSPYNQALATMYAAMLASGFSDPHARQELKTAVSLTSSPKEAMAWLNERLPGKIKVTPQNWKTFASTPEATKYLKSPDAIAHALTGIAKEAKYRGREALTGHIGPDLTQQYMFGDKNVLDRVAYEKFGDNIEKRTQWLNSVRQSQAEAANRIGVEPDVLPKLQNMHVPGRVASAHENYERMSKAIPWAPIPAPGIFESAFEVTPDTAVPTLIDTATGRGQNIRLNTSKSY